MNLEGMSTPKKILVIGLWILPVILSLAFVIYLKVSWTVVNYNGEKLAPINNKPLFVGLMLFTLGYLFFLGMIFSENIMEMLPRKFHIRR